jgi:hypothetical protein
MDDPVSTPHYFCVLGGDNYGGAGFGTWGFGCQGTRWTAGDGTAPFTLRTSTWGGDNYRWRVCLFPDCDHERNPSHNSDWSRSLAVWRKVEVSLSRMPAGGGLGPFDPLWSYGTESVPGAFDDAFVEVYSTQDGRTD